MPTARLSIPLPAGHVLLEGFGPTLTISDDGQVIGFIARRGAQPPQLWLRKLSEAEPKVVAGTESAQYAQLSPDGARLLLVRGNRLLVLDPDQGVNRVLAELGPGLPLAALWGQDGFVYFAAPRSQGDKNQPACLWRVSVEGGSPELLLMGNPPNPMPEYILPLVVLDRDRLLISTFRSTERTIEVFSISRKQRQTFYGPGSGGLWLPSGWLLFHDGDHLQAVAAQLDSLRTSGSPVVAIRNLKRAAWSGGNFAYASNGTLLYEPIPKLVGERQLVWVDMQGRETPVGLSPGSLEVASLAADGQRLLLRRYDAEGARWSLWVTDLRGGSWRAVTKGEAYRPSGVFLQDGSAVLHTSRDSRLALYRLDANSATQYPGPDSSYRQSPSVPLVGGGALFTQGYMPGRGHDILRWRPGQEYETILQSENSPALSPDGRWLLTRTLASVIHLRPYPELGSPIVVAARSGHAPIWSPDGKRIYYRDLEHMVAVDFQPGQPPKLGEPRILFADGYVAPDLWNRQYALHPDGKRFLMVKKDPTAGITNSLNLILNWPASLGR
jgi:Tol biopolymer transport system component